MPDWLKRLQEKPWVTHLMRTVQRFTTRLGTQFGAAITYFSILSLVPILLFAFAIAGFVLTVLRPDLIPQVVNAAAGALGGVDETTREKLVDFIADTLSNWRGVGVVALLSAVYSGAGWMGNLKDAVRAQMRPILEFPEGQGNIVAKVLVNLVTLLGLIVLTAVTFALASISTNLAGTIIDLMGLSAIGWLEPVFRLVPVVISIGAGWVLFMYLFAVLPEDKPRWPAARRGALLGAIGLGVLQYLTGLLFAVFSGNKAAALFGPVIVLMLFFNLFAQLILFIAAWVATADQPAIGTPEQQVRFAEHPPEVEPPAPEPPAPEPATADPARTRPPDARPEPVLVPHHVAERSVKVGTGVGYVTGAATGVGLGAVIAFVAARFGRRRH